MGITAEEYKQLLCNKMKSQSQKKNKYNASKKYADGYRFDSQLEERYYQMLKLKQKAGLIRYFLRQTRFDLPGGVKYYCDFTCYCCNGTVNYIDVKGRDTPLSKAKRKIVEGLYPIKIELATSKDF